MTGLLRALQILALASVPAWGTGLLAQHRFTLEGAAATVNFGQPFEVVVVRAWPRAHEPQPFDEAPFGEVAVRLMAATIDEQGGLLVERRRYQAVAQRAGELALGPFAVRSRDAVGVEHGASFEVPALLVASSLPEPAGEIEWPGDVRELTTARRWTWWGGAGGLLVLMIWLWQRQRRRSLPTVSTPMPVQPSAAEQALRELRELPLPAAADGACLAYYTAVAAIVRRFSTAALALRAEVRTTEELLARVSSGVEPLRRCLSACDLVKFAVDRPDAGAHERARGAAAQFVTAAADGDEHGEGHA